MKTKRVYLSDGHMGSPDLLQRIRDHLLAAKIKGIKEIYLQGDCTVDIVEGDK